MIKKISFTGVSMMLMAIPFLASAATLDRQLEVGATGSDVSAVQTFLASDPVLYPQGLVTGYFGGLTKNAVMNFQLRNEILSIGRIGPMTMAAMNYQMANGMYNKSGSVSSGPVSNSGDVVAPTIYNVNVNSVSRNSAVVSWSTDQVASGIVYYSTSPLVMSEQSNAVTVSGASLASAGVNLSNSFNVSVVGLSSNTTYYYMISSIDQSGNQSVTWPSTFRTN